MVLSKKSDNIVIRSVQSFAPPYSYKVVTQSSGAPGIVSTSIFVRLGSCGANAYTRSEAPMAPTRSTSSSSARTRSPCRRCSGRTASACGTTSTRPSPLSTRPRCVAGTMCASAVPAYAGTATATISSPSSPPTGLPHLRGLADHEQLRAQRAAALSLTMADPRCRRQDHPHRAAR